jgi:serine/threonine protein kinase
MMLTHDADWNKIQSWVNEVSEDYIAMQYQQPFVEIVSRLAHDQFYDMAGKIPKSEYQSYVVSCMYAVSCYACHRPLGLNDLYELCGKSYTKEKIIQILHNLVSWMSPDCTFRHERTHFRKRLAVNEGTLCDLVTYEHTDALFVRKRIEHNGLMPAYDAMVEVIVHYLLEETTNIARLIGIHITSTHTELYYEYVQTPLGSYFGEINDDTTVLQSILASLLHGVKNMHAVGISHRDLKGLNIHVTPDHQCMILDVGSAGYGEKRTTLPICTITHRPPDLLQAEIDGVSYIYDGTCLDMWSIGVLIVEIYMGPKPFGMVHHDSSAADMLTLIQQSKASVLETLRHMCTSSQLMMIRRCLDDVPTKRPTIDDMLNVFCFK